MSFAGIGISQLSLTPTVASSARDNEPIAREIIQARVDHLQKRYQKAKVEMEQFLAVKSPFNLSELEKAKIESTGNYEVFSDGTYVYGKLHTQNRAVETAKNEFAQIQKTLMPYRDLGLLEFLSDGPDAYTDAYKGKLRTIENLLDQQTAAQKKVEDAFQKRQPVKDQYDALKREQYACEDILGVDPIEHPNIDLLENDFRYFQEMLGLGNPVKMAASRDSIERAERLLSEFIERTQKAVEKNRELESITEKLQDIEAFMEQEYSAWPYVKDLLIQDETLPYEGPCEETVAQYRELHKKLPQVNAEKNEREQLLNNCQLKLVKQLRSLGIANCEITSRNRDGITKSLQQCTEWLDSATFVTDTMSLV